MRPKIHMRRRFYVPAREKVCAYLTRSFGFPAAAPIVQPCGMMVDNAFLSRVLQPAPRSEAQR